MGLAAVFKALSDPTRREILRLLAGGDRSAGEIAEAFAISKPSISHHLATLRHADLVSDERRGQYIFYSLNTSVLQDAAVWALDVAQGSQAPRAPGEGGGGRAAGPHARRGGGVDAGPGPGAGRGAGADAGPGVGGDAGGKAGRGAARAAGAEGGLGQ